jgi:hypothetical protein
MLMNCPYGYKVVMPDAAVLAAAGFEKVATIPAIFDSEPGYARLPSQFLMDRSLGIWDPVWRGAKPNPQPPSRTSISNYAYWLCNALEWAETRSLDLVTADYTAVLIGRYQEEMLRGIWSQSGRPLAEETVNARVQTALDYQTWAADKGHRGPFTIPTVTRTHVAGSHLNSKSHEAVAIEARKGKVKVNKRSLIFPTNPEIKAWRDRICQEPVVGATHGLMVDHVLNTAIRREELACWRVDTLPLKEADWKLVNPAQPEEHQQVVVTVEFGAKGRQFYIDDFGDKVGPRGTIHLPLWLAKRIHQYRKGERLKALRQATRGVRDRTAAQRILERSVHLYVNPRTGRRYTGADIYGFWTKGTGPEHWSPHLGRDWWACQHLWQRMQQHAALLAQLHGLGALDARHPILLSLRDTVQTVIRLEIKPQLRHASSRTTETYVQWLFDQLRVPLDVTRRWQMEDEEAALGESK